MIKQFSALVIGISMAVLPLAAQSLSNAVAALNVPRPAAFGECVFNAVSQ
jgi:hypothetical protein